jgi:hypothetical protein
MEILLCTEQHAWFRLTAFATFVPIVRAVINRIDASTGILNVRPHASVNLLEIGLCHRTAIYAGLVGDKNYSVARLAEEHSLQFRTYAARGGLRFRTPSRSMMIVGWRRMNASVEGSRSSEPTL